MEGCRRIVHGSGSFQPGRARVVGSLGAALILLAACDPELPQDLGDCPADSTVAWVDVEPLFAEHCTRCHASTLTTVAERREAPFGTDFDTPGAARINADLTWTNIWSGEMPSDGDSTLEREDALRIREWLACGGPE